MIFSILFHIRTELVLCGWEWTCWSTSFCVDCQFHTWSSQHPCALWPMWAIKYPGSYRVTLVLVIVLFTHWKLYMCGYVCKLFRHDSTTLIVLPWKVIFRVGQFRFLCCQHSPTCIYPAGSTGRVLYLTRFFFLSFFLSSGNTSKTYNFDMLWPISTRLGHKNHWHMAFMSYDHSGVQGHVGVTGVKKLIS